MSDWNPALYLRFKKERTQPAEDLAARLELTPAKALDVGCGPGNSTQVVANRFPGAKVLGVDFSSNMVGAAQRAHPELEFLQCDVSTQLDTLPHDFDLVFSNACIQWVPEHPRLLPGLLSLLNPGGVLAVQVPMNFQEPIHQIIARTVEREEWRERIPYHRNFYTLKPEEYFDLLANSTRDFTMWETTYMHRMPSHQSIMEWYSSTGLRPYLDAAVDEESRQGRRRIQCRKTGRLYSGSPGCSLLRGRGREREGERLTARGRAQHKHKRPGGLKVFEGSRGLFSKSPPGGVWGKVPRSGP